MAVALEVYCFSLAALRTRIKTIFLINLFFKLYHKNNKTYFLRAVKLGFCKLYQVQVQVLDRNPYGNHDRKNLKQAILLLLSGFW